MSANARPRVTVVGIGAEGWAGLPERLRAVVSEAPVVLGGRRHLDLVPAVAGQVRECWPTPLRSGLPALLERYADQPVVALASGDPLVSGIGSTLIGLLGPDAVRVEPAVSSVALARARMGWAAEEHDVVSLVGRDPHAVLRALAPGRRVLVLSADETTPVVVARLLVAHGCAGSTVTVLGDLGDLGGAESRLEGSASEWADGRCGPAARLNVVAVEVVHDGAGSPASADRPVPTPFSWAPGLPDAAYEHDGQLTKRDLRASALARLAPAPGQLLWDVGAGAGSVGIEWLRAHPTCRAIAVESHPERVERIGRNAAALGVPQLQVVAGRAPEALPDLPTPDAVFVGGGASRPGVLDACRTALQQGGRLVVHAVTLETERVLVDAHAEHGGDLTRILVEHAEPVGTFTGWTPARAVTQWSWEKP